MNECYIFSETMYSSIFRIRVFDLWLFLSSSWRRAIFKKHASRATTNETLDFFQKNV